VKNLGLNHNIWQYFSKGFLGFLSHWIKEIVFQHADYQKRHLRIYGEFAEIKLYGGEKVDRV